MAGGSAVAWNEEFQRLRALPADSALARLQRLAAVRRLSLAFIAEATATARVIISEVLRPDEQRSIRETRAGGVAGGAKCDPGLPRHADWPDTSTATSSSSSLPTA